jgi:CheY-like chemotaxis protein
MKKILLMDDEELLTKTFARFLEKCGYEVFVAAHGDDAIVMIEEENFDLIISDIRMPGRNGVEVVTEIHRMTKDKNKNEIPVIFVSGFADHEVKEQAEKLQPIAYLSKPFDLAVFKENVSKALGE